MFFEEDIIKACDRLTDVDKKQYAVFERVVLNPNVRELNPTLRAELVKVYENAVTHTRDAIYAELLLHAKQKGVAALYQRLENDVRTSIAKLDSGTEPMTGPDDTTI